MICALCHQQYNIAFSYSILFTSVASKFCDSCNKKLERVIKGCPYCFKKGTIAICDDCNLWKSKDSLIQHHTVYYYNDYAKEIINLIKYNGDISKITAFEYDVRQALKSYSRKKYYIVPVPIHHDKYELRGFNQAKVISDLLPFKQLQLFKKTVNITQSKRNKMERINAKDDFSLLNPHINLEGYHIIIIDDIYTTGSTIQQLVNLLKPKRVKEIISFSLFRS